MPKYCRAPNCSSTAGKLGSDNRPVSFYKFPLKDGPRLQAWLHHMGCEHWVPSCHQHLCSKHFTPSCFQWRWGVRYLRPDAVPSIFSRASPGKRQQRTRSTKKLMTLLLRPQQEAASAPQQPACAASGPVRCVVLGPTSRVPEAVTTVLLTPSSLPSASAGQRPGDLAQHPQAGLRATLGALQQRVSRLQRRQEQRQAQLRALEQLAQQLCRESLLVRACRGPLCLPGPEESQTFTIICGGPAITMVLSQGPAPATLDAKPEPLDTRMPGTQGSE